MGENNDDDSVNIDRVYVNMDDDNQFRVIYSQTICLDLGNCGQNKAIFNLNTMLWENANNQNLICN